MLAMIRGFDISNYAGPVDSSTMLALACSEDFSRVILGTQDRDIFEAQYASAILADMEVEAYIYLYNTGASYKRKVETILSTFHFDVLGNHDISRIWLDIEDETAPLPHEADITAALDVLGSAGLEHGIYTRLDYWQGIGNPQFGRRTPLWLAQWDNDPSNLELPTPFGGWLRARCKQYASPYTSYGVTMDLNSWSR